MHSPTKTNPWMTHADGNLWRQVVSDTYISVFSWCWDSFQQGMGDNFQVVRKNRCLVWEKKSVGNIPVWYLVKEENKMGKRRKKILKKSSSLSICQIFSIWSPFHMSESSLTTVKIWLPYK